RIIPITHCKIRNYGVHSGYNLGFGACYRGGAFGLTQALGFSHVFGVEESTRLRSPDIQSPAGLTEMAVKTEYQDLDSVLCARPSLPVCTPSVSSVPPWLRISTYFSSTSSSIAAAGLLFASFLLVETSS